MTFDTTSLAAGFYTFLGAYMTNVKLFGALTATAILVAFVANVVLAKSKGQNSGWIVIAAGGVWLGILLLLTIADYMSRGWLATGHIPTVLGMWWVHLLVLVIALLWLRRQGRMVGKG